MLKTISGTPGSCRGTTMVGLVMVQPESSRNGGPRTYPGPINWVFTEKTLQLVCWTREPEVVLVIPLRCENLPVITFGYAGPKLVITQ